MSLEDYIKSQEEKLSKKKEVGEPQNTAQREPKSSDEEQ